MGNDDERKGPGRLTPLSAINPRRIEAGTAPVKVRALTLQKPAAKAPEHRDGPPLFETVRVVDLARYRAGIARSITRRADGGSAADKRQALLKMLDQLRELSPDGMPHVAVVKRSQTEGLTTNYAIVGNLIFLGAHLSKSWATGKEDAAFHDALGDAVSAYLRKLAAVSGTRVIRRPFHN